VEVFASSRGCVSGELASVDAGASAISDVFCFAGLRNRSVPKYTTALPARIIARHPPAMTLKLIPWRSRDGEYGTLSSAVSPPGLVFALVTEAIVT